MKKKILMLAFVMLTLAVFVGCSFIEQADTLTFTELPKTLYQKDESIKVTVTANNNIFKIEVTNENKINIYQNEVLVKDLASTFGFNIEVIGSDMTAVGSHNVVILLKVNGEIKATLNYSYTVVGTTSKDFEGEGTATVPYIVSTPAQLMLIGTEEKYKSSAFILANDIDFTGFDYATNRKDNTIFTGVLDGNNYSIINYAWEKPLFDTVKGLEDKTTIIKNIHFKNFQYTSYDNKIDGVFAYEDVTGKVTIENVTIDNNSKINNAGFFKYINGTIKIINCINNAYIYAEDAAAGGFISRIEGGTCEFVNCTNNGKILSAFRCGAGFIGDNSDGKTTFNSCINNGNIYGGHRYGEGDWNGFYNGFFVGRRNNNLTFVNTNTNTGNIYKREADESYVDIKDYNFINKGKVVEEYKKIDDLIFDEITFKPVALADKDNLSKSITINTKYLPINTKYIIVTYSGGYGSSRNQIDSKVFVLDVSDTYTYTFKGTIPETKNGKNFGDKGVCYIVFSISAYDVNGEFLGSKMTNA